LLHSPSSSETASGDFVLKRQKIGSTDPCFFVLPPPKLLVPTLKIEQPPTDLPLYIRNRHERDDHITFIPEKHEYFVRGKKARFSVTEFKEYFTPPFDTVDVIKKMTRGRLRNGRYQGRGGGGDPLAGKTPLEIKEYWESLRDRGSEFHALLEAYYNDPGYRTMSQVERRHCLEEADVNGRYKFQIEAFLVLDEKLRKNGWVIFQTEYYVYDEEMGIAGSIDAIFTRTHPKSGIREFLVGDWKTVTKNNLREGRGRCQYPLQNMPGTKLSGFAIQLSIYAYILKKNWGYNVTEIWAYVFFPMKLEEHKIIPLDVPMLFEVISQSFRNRDKIITWYQNGTANCFELPEYPTPAFID